MALGEVIFDFPATEGNPRNSEGAFLSLSENELIFVYSRFVGGTGKDADDCNLYLIRSTDNGDSWDEGTTLFSGKDEGVNIMSVSLLHMNDGAIGLFYLIRKSKTVIHLYLRRSYDGGRSWTEKHPCITRQGMFVVNNDRVIRHSSGRIIVPAAFHHSGYSISPNESPNDGYVETHADTVFFFSDDDGENFGMSAKCILPYAAIEKAGLQEPGVVELKNGALWGWARTELGRQYEMLSVYRGSKWTAPQPSQFTSPLSPLSMKRAQNGDLVAVWNPLPKHNGMSRQPYGLPTAGRYPLVVALSHDDGESFTNPYPIETERGSGYCYTALHTHGDYVFVAYSTDCLTGLRCRRFTLSELTELCDNAGKDLFSWMN